MNKIKIFLLPYAGASSFAYYSWKEYFPDRVIPVFTELAGRGLRGDEPFYTDIYDAAEDMAKYIMKETEDSEYMIFGHSMGGLITFETYYKLISKGWKKPMHIFISGQRPPHMINRGIHVSEFSDDEFLDIVSSYGGLPKEFFEEEIKKAFLPVLRADFGILSEYEITPKKEKINCPVSILYGDKDANVKESEVVYWSEYVNDNVDFHSFSGGHFFIREYESEIIQLILKAAGEIHKGEENGKRSSK